MSVIHLLGIARNCGDLDATSEFYRHACGFLEGKPAADEEVLMPSLRSTADPMPARRWLWRGRQPLLLLQAATDARPAPHPLPGCDLAFQHIALVTEDIAAAHAVWLEHGVRPISSEGPQQLPPESGGVSAFKGYDPDGHPLELLSFPPDKGPRATRGGIDHSAISVRDSAASIAFYQDLLGLDCSTRQVNRGVEQDRLDGLADVEVEVVALNPRGSSSPHVELLAYRRPAPEAPDAPTDSGDIAVDHLLFLATELEALAVRLSDHGSPISVRGEDQGGPSAIATQDPDGHHLVILSAD